MSSQPYDERQIALAIDKYIRKANLESLRYLRQQHQQYLSRRILYAVSSVSVLAATVSAILFAPSLHKDFSPWLANTQVAANAPENQSIAGEKRTNSRIVINPQITGKDALSQQGAAAKQTLGQERGRAEILARELAAAHNEVKTLKSEIAAKETAANQQLVAAKQALDQERSRAEALTQELTGAQGEIKALKSQITAKEAATKEALDQERGKAEALARELAAARDEITALKPQTMAGEATAKEATAKEAASKKASDQERSRAEVARAVEERCGWLVHPTPQNWWLTDAAGRWLIMRQDRDTKPAGMDLIPNPPRGGYACACLSVETNRGQKRITRILSVKQKPAATCRTDPKLPKP